MFKRKPKAQPETEPVSTDEPKRRKFNWFVISIVVNALLFIGVVGYVSAAAIIHKSDTDPNFCATCHVMQKNVDSYQNGNTLDHVHAEAGVMCKDCHSSYDIVAEATTGVNFFIGNYTIADDGELSKRDFDDDICTQCHGDMMSVARSTDFLYYNPHNSGMGTFTCDTCHVSHGEQIDYCSTCHTNGGQRMIEDDTERTTKLGAPVVSTYGG